MTLASMGLFAENLRLLVGADRGGMPVNELARHMRTDGKAVRRWLSGESVPSVEKAAEIADVLGVSLDALMGRAPLRGADEGSGGARDRAGDASVSSPARARASCTAAAGAGGTDDRRRRGRAGAALWGQVIGHRPILADGRPRSIRTEW